MSHYCVVAVSYTSDYRLDSARKLYFMYVTNMSIIFVVFFILMVCKVTFFPTDNHKELCKAMIHVIGSVDSWNSSCLFFIVDLNEIALHNFNDCSIRVFCL